MSLRLVILTEVIAPYRIPVFNALAEQPGIDLQVIFLSETDPSLRQWNVYKDEIRFAWEVLPSWRRRIGKYNLLLNRGLSAALGRMSPKVLICGGYNYLASWEALWWARRHRIPMLLWSESTARDLRSGHLLTEALKNRFLQSCDGFVVPGKSSWAYLESLGVTDRPIITAPNAVDNDFFASAAANARQKGSELRCRLGLPTRYFLYVGRLIPEKGIFDLLAAYARLEASLRSEIGMVFVGDGIARSQLQEGAAKIRPGNMQVRGFAQREQLAEFYALAEVFVFPTRSDPWGLVVNEAMACGLPIIATDVAGCIADLVGDEWNGRVVPANAPAPFAGAMHALACDAGLRERMSARSRERISRYSPKDWAAGLTTGLVSYGIARHE